MMTMTSPHTPQQTMKTGTPRNSWTTNLLKSQFLLEGYGHGKGHFEKVPAKMAETAEKEARALLVHKQIGTSSTFVNHDDYIKP